jgi:RNA polymerase sigma-70 factor (ECF subfamily)
MIGANAIRTGLTVMDASTRARPLEDGRLRERFRVMVDAHFDFIWRSLRGMGVEPSSVDDAAQHVFWTAYQKLASILPGCERAFLFQTALGVARNARRARARSRARELPGGDEILERADERPSPEELVGLKEARAVLDRILAQMPEDIRAVFVCFELEGLETKEIARLLDLAEGTVASRLRRARKVFHSAAKRVQARLEGRP